MNYHKKQIWLPIILLLLLVTACQNQVAPLSSTSTPIEATVALPTLVPTELPPDSLVICTAQEPLTLYPYGSDNWSMWSVLEAIYDGPIDMVNFTPQPIILQQIPSYENGMVVEELSSPNAGDPVVDSNGDVMPFIKGVSVFPAGCSDAACAIEWDGVAEIQLPQLKVSYQLLEGILWSDGEALTMADSVYSFQLASDPATPVNRFLIERTASYLSEDANTLTWTGIPGYLSNDFENFFWLPLPEHVYQGRTAADLLTDPQATRKPIGWGPYQIDNWVPGSHIALSRNPNYFRATQGLPKFESLTFQFLGEHADSNLKGLEIGECDLVDSTVALDEQLVDLVENNNLGKLKAYFGLGPEWEHLDFGMVPASYDDGYQIGQDRPDWFGDLRMRQAFAYCTDRETIANRYFVNRSAVPTSFFPPSHPQYDESLTILPYDPEKGMKLLDDIGWKDDDQNPATPRVAAAVLNVVDGTPLVLDYVTTQSDLRVLVATDLSQSLAGCGIEISVHHLLPNDLYAPGPQGVMFGRNFDLAQFTWQSGRQSPCFLYTSSQVPNATNLWVGTNVSGYQNVNYDLACSQSKDDPTAPQKIFNEELPVLPLYYQLKTAASRPDFCGMDNLDVSSRSALWNLENFGYAQLCTKND